MEIQTNFKKNIFKGKFPIKKNIPKGNCLLKKRFPIHLILWNLKFKLQPLILYTILLLIHVLIIYTILLPIPYLFMHLILQFTTLHQFQLLIDYKLHYFFSFSPSNFFFLIFTFKLLHSRFVHLPCLKIFHISYLLEFDHILSPLFSSTLTLLLIR